MLRFRYSRKAIVVLFVIASILYCLFSTVWKLPVLKGIFKVLPIFIIFFALLRRRYNLTISSKGPFAQGISSFVILALTGSILGDAAGEMKAVFGDAAFIAQIFFFCLAQLFYALSFSRYCGKRRMGKINMKEKNQKVVIGVLLLCYYVMMVYVLILHVDVMAMKIMAMTYLTLIAVMSFLSLGQRRPGQEFFIIGALLFVLTDSILAMHTFVQRIPNCQLVIMPTYFAAQMFLNVELIPKR